MSSLIENKFVTSLGAVMLASTIQKFCTPNRVSYDQQDKTRSLTSLNQNNNYLQIIDRVISTLVQQHSIRLQYLDEDTQTTTSLVSIIGMDSKENQDQLASILNDLNSTSALELINKMYQIIGTNKNNQYVMFFSNSDGPLSLNDAIAQVEQTVISQGDSLDMLFQLMGTSSVAESITSFLSIIGTIDSSTKTLKESLDLIYNCIGTLDSVDESLVTVDSNLVQYIDCLNYLIGTNTNTYINFYSKLQSNVTVPMTISESVNKVDTILDWMNNDTTVFEEVEFLQDSSQIEAFEPLVETILEQTYINSFVTSPMSKVDSSTDLVPSWSSIISGNQSLLDGNNIFSMPLAESVINTSATIPINHTINLYYESIGLLYSIQVKNVNSSYSFEPLAVLNAFRWVTTSFVSQTQGSIPRTLLVNVSKDSSTLSVTFAFKDALQVTVAYFNCIFTIPSMTNYLQSRLYITFSSLSPVSMGILNLSRSTLIDESKHLLLSVPVLFKLPSSVFSQNNVDCLISLPDFGAIAKLMFKRTSSGDSVSCVTLTSVNNLVVSTTNAQNINDSIRFLLIESKCSNQSIVWSVRGTSKEFRIVCETNITCTYPMHLLMSEDAFGLHWQNLQANQQLLVYRMYNLVQDELEQMPHSTGQFLSVQDGKAVFTSSTKTFDDLLEQSNYTIFANQISFNNCNNISTSSISFNDIKIPQQSTQPMPNHVIMSTPEGPRWKRVEYPHSKYVQSIVQQQNVSNTGTQTGTQTNNTLQNTNQSLEESYEHKVKIIGQSSFQCTQANILEIALPLTTTDTEDTEDTTDQTTQINSTDGQVQLQQNTETVQVDSYVENVVAQQSLPINEEIERCFEMSEQNLTREQKLEELQRRRRRNRNLQNSSLNTVFEQNNQSTNSLLQCTQNIRSNRKKSIERTIRKKKQTFPIKFNSTVKAGNDNRQQEEQKTLKNVQQTDPFEDIHDEDYVLGEEDQVIQKTVDGPRWVDRPIPPYTLPMILEQGNNANTMSITDIRHLRTTNTGNISCTTLITNCIHVTNSEGKNFAGNNGHVLTQTRNGVRWMPMPIGRVKRVIYIQDEQQYPAYLQGFDQSVIVVLDNYSHGKYPAYFGRMLFIETKYYDDDFNQREMTIGTSFTIYNYSSSKLNVVLDRSPAGYADVPIVTTNQTIVVIPPRVIINDTEVPQAAVFTNLSMWDVRYLVIAPNG